MHSKIIRLKFEMNGAQCDIKWCKIRWKPAQNIVRLSSLKQFFLKKKQQGIDTSNRVVNLKNC